MRFTLTIEMENAAFEPQPTRELRRMLREMGAPGGLGRAEVKANRARCAT